MKPLTLLFVFVLLCGCQREPPVVPPNVQKLVGTWELREPLSPYMVQLRLALDTQNPPRDITPFVVSGTVAAVGYGGRMSAALDGVMVFTNLTDVPAPASPASAAFVKTYLANLKSVVQFRYTSTDRLRLSFSAPTPGMLEFEKMN